MARAHGVYAEVRSIVVAVAAIGAIAVIGLARDVVLEWTDASRTATVLRVAVTREVFADAVASIGGPRVDMLPLLAIDGAASAGGRIDEYVRRTADMIITGGPFVDAEVLREIIHRRDQHARLVDAGAGMPETFGDQSSTADGDKRPSPDHYFWLDADAAITMAGTIRNALIAEDPDHADEYRERALQYIVGIREADAASSRMFGVCRTRAFVEGGGPHFSHLARRYNLLYYAVNELPSGEIPPLAGYAAVTGNRDLRYIFYDDRTDARLAESIARISGASLLPLSSGASAHAKGGRSFSLAASMRENAERLKIGMECRSGRGE